MKKTQLEDLSEFGINYKRYKRQQQRQHREIVIDGNLQSLLDELTNLKQELGEECEIYIDDSECSYGDPARLMVAWDGPEDDEHFAQRLLRKHRLKHTQDRRQQEREASERALLAELLKKYPEAVNHD